MRHDSERPTAFGKNPPRVLVVDDDDAVRRLFARLLEALGCVVAAVGTGHEARKLAGIGARWDVVVVDLTLPDTDGVTLVRELELLIARRPAFLVVSGHAIARGELGVDVADVLRKPIEPNALRRAMKAVMTGRRSSPPEA